MTDHTKALLEALKEAHTRMTELSYRVPDAFRNEDWVFIQNGLPDVIAQAEASLAEPVTPRAKLIWDAKALIRALKLPVGGGVAMNQNDVWCWYKHRPEWNARQMNWEIAGLIHCSPIPVDTLPKWPGSAETSWITLDTPETEASPHPEKGEA